MRYRLVSSGWNNEVCDALTNEVQELCIVSPFIKAPALERLICRRPDVIRAITRLT
jgi:hypothetical protein